MKKKSVMALWAGMFILCAALGFIREPEGVLRSVLTIVSVLFFVPPFVLLREAGKASDVQSVTLVRNLSALSLLLSMVLLILNFLSIAASETLGNVIYYVLVIVSSPMICSGYWALSLFLWACLLTLSRNMLKKK